MIKNVIFIFVVLAAVFVVYLPSYMQMQDLRNRNEVFEKRIKDLELNNIKLEHERGRLKNDPEYFEKVARERMGLIKEDEVIYKVVPQGTKKAEADEAAKRPDPAKTAAKKKILKKTSTTKVKDATKAKDVTKTKDAVIKKQPIND